MFTSTFLNAPLPQHSHHKILHPLFPKNQIQFRPHLESNCFKNPNSMRKLATIFRSTKPSRPLLSNSKSPIKRLSKETSDSTVASTSTPPSASSLLNDSPSSLRRKGRKGRGVRNGGSGAKRKRMRVSAWSVYLIVSLRLARTYVGVTTNFTRRLKQHNGELKGGAKASSAGRPWSLACIIRGFENRSEACEFEAKWKNISKKLTRKKKEDSAVRSVLRHREEALNRVETSFDSTRLKVEWQSTQS